MMFVVGLYHGRDRTQRSCFKRAVAVNREHHTSFRVSSSDAFGQSNTFDQPRGIVNN